jgi:hydrophobic/amphiphilic exporter-1 (mainly G- bacteria), HAE1 family
MNISEPFIRRPVMTTTVMLGILLFGIMAYRLLPVSDLPNVDFPSIQVNASLPGASPETMASAVAMPLERQFTTIAGLDTMNSVNNLGYTQITLQFSLSRNLDAAAQDVQAAIARAATLLPRDLPSPPSYTKVNPADQPVLYLALTSPTLPLSTIDEYGETILAQSISMISGVAQVQLFGAQKYAVRVQLDPHALASRKIGIDEVATAIQNGNVNLPVGTLYGPRRAFTLEASGQLVDGRSYMPLIVAYRNGSPVRIQDIGRAIDSVENDKTAAWFMTRELSERAVVLGIQRQPGTNTMEVVNNIKSRLPALAAKIPASVEIRTIYDRSESIRDSVNDVRFTLYLTLALVVLVIFLFLRKLSATVIPSLALPMSVVGTFSVMYLLDYSLDNLSLMALTLSVGFVVDDAIVMLENIVRHMERGEPPFVAALNGSREIGFTIVSMTISLAAVFIPVLFMGGILGRLFREFAVTIGVAILVSGVVSLTLTPMLASRFLRPESRAPGRLYGATERFFDGMLWLYRISLEWVLRHRLSTLIASLAILIATLYLFAAIPKGFLPATDQNQIFGYTDAAQGISHTALFELQQAVAEAVRGNPQVEQFMSSAGARPGLTGSNTGFVFIRIKDRALRKESIDEVIQDLRRRVAPISGMNVYFQVPAPIRIGNQLTKSQYQYTIQSPDTDEMYRSTPKLEAEMARQAKRLGLRDITTDMQIKNPKVSVEIDRDKSAMLGVTAGQIESALSQAYGTRQISTIYAPNNQYQVIIELLPGHQLDPAALSLLYIRSATGKLVPLSTVANLKETVGPLSINHLGQLPAVTISFNLETGFSLGEAVNEIDRMARNILPPNTSASFQGAAQVFQSSVAGLGVLLILAIVVIYMVLAILYESFIHPLTILSALPFAGFGALVTLEAFHTELSVYAFVGIIMLVGLVKKNGIMMVDFAIEAERKGGRRPAEAIFEACLVRFRPIMMTTMAALMGTLPIALGYGSGAEARRPLGLAVVGGLLFSQTLTLYVTPVVYLYLDRLQGRWRKRRAAAPAPVAAGEAVPA